MTSPVGMQIGNFVIRSELGSGGFAKVYLAEHLNLPKYAAIKVLTAQLVTQEMVDRFQQEARIIVQLEHPHIVKVQDFTVQHGFPYLVMEYAPGGTLRARHPLGTTVPLDRVVGYVKQLASALHYAHGQPFHIVHRDVKPANMLVGRTGEILLADFGIATVEEATSYQGQAKEISGTATYMAPEQSLGRPHPASDQYALAVVVYQWLAGAPPFQGTPAELSSQHLHLAPPPLSQRAPGVPPLVEEVVMTALSKQPNERFGNVWAFATALEQASNPGRPSGAHAAPPPAPPQATPAARMSVGTLYSLYSEHGVKVTSLVWVGNGQQEIASFGENAILHVWNVATQQRVSTYPNKPLAPGTRLLSLHWAPDKKRFASLWSGGQVQVWDIVARQEVCLYETRPVRGVAWSPRGEKLASFGDGRVVSVWDATTGKELGGFGIHTSAVSAVAWSPDGRLVASAEESGQVQVWKADDWQTLATLRGHAGKVVELWWVDVPAGQGVVVSREARGASPQAKDHLRVWEAQLGARKWGYEEQFGPLSALTADGRLLAWRDAQHPNQAQVLVIDPDQPRLAQGQAAPSYPIHAAAIEVLAWSPKERHLASGSADHEVRVWDGEQGKVFYRFQGHHAPITALAWSGDGQRLASADASGQVQVWQAAGVVAEGLHVSPPPAPAAPATPPPTPPPAPAPAAPHEPTPAPIAQEQPTQGPTQILSPGILPSLGAPDIGQTAGMGSQPTPTPFEWQPGMTPPVQAPRRPRTVPQKMLARGERTAWWVKLLAGVDVFVAPLLAGLLFNSYLVWIGLGLLSVGGCILALLPRSGGKGDGLIKAVMLLFALMWAGVGVAIGVFFAAGVLRVLLAVLLAVLGGVAGAAHGLLAQNKVK